MKHVIVLLFVLLGVACEHQVTDYPPPGATLTKAASLFPNVTVQVANLGGTLPFLLERMDEVTRERTCSHPLPSEQPTRCYVDTASFGPRALHMTVACFGAERVLLGTDFPIFDTARQLQSLDAAGLDDTAVFG